MLFLKFLKFSYHALLAVVCYVFILLFLKKLNATQKMNDDRTTGLAYLALTFLEAFPPAGAGEVWAAFC